MLSVTRKSSCSEAEIELPVVAWAEKEGWFVRKLQWIGRWGAPDRVFIKGGVVCFIEFKRPGAKPRPSQRGELRRMKKAGAAVAWFDDVEKAIQWLKRQEAKA